MGQKDLHAVVYKDRAGDGWVAICLEYDIATEGESEHYALAMIREAVELHFEGATRQQLEQIDRKVGSEPVIRRFTVSAPAVLDG